ncbi:hypothetical protein PR202_gb01502 [Eleusine coracana subsp. coracana]|uniref:Histone H4 n=1 Tax=Eleusine coracana subsp. coracana TaxID=191504 RepID=A0AAV5DXL1_ELECO|nr:hypothetical protein PR202_gb01502 [Eleusine coracana subsp. coracana]
MYQVSQRTLFSPEFILAKKSILYLANQESLAVPYATRQSPVASFVNESARGNKQAKYAPRASAYEISEPPHQFIDPHPCQSPIRASSRLLISPVQSYRIVRPKLPSPHLSLPFKPLPLPQFPLQAPPPPRRINSPPNPTPLPRNPQQQPCRRGKGGKGLVKGGAKRHREGASRQHPGITSRRSGAWRGGEAVKRISGLIYEENPRRWLKIFLENVIRDAVTYTDRPPKRHRHGRRLRAQAPGAHL